MNTALQTKQLLLQEFTELYDLFRKYGVNQSHIRTRVFNPLKFPKVSLADDHKQACTKHASLMNEKDLKVAVDNLKIVLEKYVIYNNKIVQFYPMNADVLSIIDDSMENQIASKSNGGLVDYYPGFPEDSMLIDESIQPIKSNWTDSGKKVFLVGSRREYYKVFQLSKKDLTQNALSLIQDVK